MVFIPSSVYVENNQGDDFNEVPDLRQRRGLFWRLLAPVIGVEPERYPSPGSLDWQLDAVARRDARIMANNSVAPKVTLGMLAGDVIDEVREAAAKFAKVTKIDAAKMWLSNFLVTGRQDATLKRCRAP
jgi:hypothetical protein